MEKTTTKPTLAWKRDDFILANSEIPDSLLADEIHTEGELMSNQEIVDWYLDNKRTLSVLKGRDQELFDKLFSDYLIDVDYLLKIKKITDEEADILIKMEVDTEGLKE